MNLDELYRREYGHILASLIRVVRDFALAEDALQDAFAAALTRWPERGTPENPVAWLLTTARHKAIDQIRHRTMAEAKHAEMIAHLQPEESAPEPMDTLRLIFTCCHPAIAPEAQVALTLRTICGLRTEEIARAFVLPVPTLARRLARAQEKIRLAGIPYEVPEDEALPERLEAVLAVVYLVFNEGYCASFGADLVRANLCREAIRLARELVALLPDLREPKGLLALMLLNDARRATRTDEVGDLVLLEDQDRSKWDQAKITEGSAWVEQSLRGGAPGVYALQAAIAALHAQAASSAETDWPQIVILYEILLRVQPSTIIALNHAAAVAMADGLEKGLDLMEQMSLPGYYLLPAAKADLLRRLDRKPEAARAYREALTLAGNDATRRYLEKRLREVS